MKHLLLNKLLLTGILILFSTGFIFAQNISVQGKVTSEDNPDGILGVTVSAAGTTKATTTGTKGHFMLSDIRANDSLIFSFVGNQNMGYNGLQVMYLHWKHFRIIDLF